MKQSQIAKILFISGLVLLGISLVLSLIFLRSRKTSDQTAGKPETLQIEPEPASDDASPAEQVILARDTERKIDIDSLNASMKAFYAVHKSYPTIQDMNSAEFRRLHLKDLEPGAFADPQDKDSFSLILGGPQSKSYAYDVRTAKGSSCDNSDLEPCVSYVLSAKLEEGGFYTVKSN